MAGITRAEVAAMLGESFNSVNELCRSTKINKWSKWKPVRVKTYSGITPSQLQTANYGLKPPDRTTDYTTIVNTKWEYVRPLGDGNSPFRLGDFRNYNKNAGAIARVEDISSIDLSAITNKQFSLMLNTGDSNDLISLSDFGGVIGNYYYGIVFEKGTSKYIQTSPEPISAGEPSFEVPADSVVFGGTSVKLNYLLCSKAVPIMTELGTAGTIYYMPIPTEDFVVCNPTVTLRKTAPLSRSITHIGTEASRFMFDIGAYVGGMNTIPFPTLGNIYFKIELTNRNSNNVILSGYNFTINADPTYYGAHTTKYAAKMYDTNGNIISSITVPKAEGGINGKASVIIGADFVMTNGTSGVPTPNQIVNTNIRVYQSGSLFISTNINCKASLS